MTLNTLRKKLSQLPLNQKVNLPASCQKLSENFLHAQTLIRCFYCALFFLSVPQMREWGRYLNHQDYDFLWPVYWLNWFPQDIGIQLILYLSLFGTLIGALTPSLKSARVLAFLGVFLFQALHNSFGKISHSFHLWHIIAAFLIFLPAGWHCITNQTRKTKLLTLQTIWFATAFLLMTYSMSGLGKIACGIGQLVMGDISLFHPMSMSIHVATRLMETNTQSEFGSWIVEIGVFSWPLVLSATYLQFTSLICAFRPQLMKLWGLGLIIFHLSVWFTFKIPFFPTCLIVALLLFASPLANGHYTWKQILLSLPGLGLCKFIFRAKNEKNKI
ncbi:MAG: hypothetical protein AAF984_07540 [Verrucomicrobiota bacterium]